MGEGQVPPEIIEAAAKYESAKAESGDDSERSAEQDRKSFVESGKQAHETLMAELIRPVREQARNAKELLKTERSEKNFEDLLTAHEQSGFTALSKAELNELREFLTHYILEIDPTFKARYRSILARLQDDIDQTESDND